MAPRKPNEMAFGIRADGKLIDMVFLSAQHAARVGAGLFRYGHKTIEIVDRATGGIVKRLSPP